MPQERRVPALVDRGRDVAQQIVNVVEQALGSNEWILGDTFSAADIMLVFGLMIADYLGYVNEATPRVRGYVDRAMARPAFQRAAAS